MEISNGTIPLAPLLTKLGVMLTLSLMVERFLAAINWVVNRLFLIQVSADLEITQEKENQLELTSHAMAEAEILASSPDPKANLPADPHEIEPHPHIETTPAYKNSVYINPDSRFDIKKVKEAKEIDARTRIKVIKEFWLQILGLLVAVVGCYYMKFSIWVFVTWAAKGSFEAIAANRLEYIFTGIIIGAGSKPVYFLMNFLINRKFVMDKEKLQPEAQAAEPAASSEIAGTRNGQIIPLSAAAQPPHKTIEELVGFIYDGGDRPQRLESTHFFQKPIDLIVYHHTAMHSDSPYQEITREFDRKGWLTGYHCIVFKDGTIRVLCRWDRFGNHAQGYNNHSFGVALHGNFETNPKVPFSNYKGQFGITQPTPEQVDSTARIAALWALLRNIAVAFPAKTDPNFPKGLVPHKDISQKACPGGNFPHEKFRQSVKHYAAAWKQDPTFMDALTDFSEHPMVKV